MCNSRFCALPAELRNRIYEEALTLSKPVSLDEASKTPALLQTCQKIRNDALPLHYSTNTFSGTFSKPTMSCLSEKIVEFEKSFPGRLGRMQKLQFRMVMARWIGEDELTDEQLDEIIETFCNALIAGAVKRGNVEVVGGGIRIGDTFAYASEEHYIFKSAIQMGLDTLLSVEGEEAEES